ncbi:MAG: CdaR family protein, partial [Vicinamibacteria bacterium]
MRERLTDHLGLKLVSLVLGFSLWYAVSREQEAEFSVVIPIELRDLPEGLEVIEESVQQVDVRLRGPAEILRRLTPQEVNIGVDLSDAEPGERLAYLAPRDVAAPFAARVMRVTPT